MANERILVLEDHAPLREQLEQALVDAGFQVQSAATAADALALARQHTFDLIIADIFLPDGSGIEVFRQLREHLHELAGIVITGHSTWELAIQALNAGFVGFLVKPVVTEQLTTAVINALEQEKLRRENARLRAIVPLFELSKTFMGNFSLDELLQRIVTVAQRETRAHIVSLMLLDPTESELRVAAAVGLPEEIIASERVPVGHGIAGRVVQSGEPLMLAESVPLDPEIRRLMKKPEVLSSLSLPLRVRNQVIGVLNLSRMHGDESFNTSDLELATVFAEQAALAITQARLFDQLRALNEITQALASAVELEQALTILVSAPARLVDARATTLWLDATLAPPARFTIAQGKDQIHWVSREQILTHLTAPSETTRVVLPLQHGDRLVGALEVQLPAPSAMREERLGAMRSLAHTASAVIESLSSRARQVGALRQMDDALHADWNLQQLLDRLLAEMISVCEAEGGAIFLRNETDDRLEVWSAVQFTDGEDVAHTILQERRVQIFTHPRDPASTLLGVPLVIGGYPDGVVVLRRAAALGGFTRQHSEWLTALANVAALAIRNAQLYARSEEAAIIEERTRIAREIHDGLAQDLTYLVLKISAAQKLASQGRLKELHKELDEISTQLRRDMRDVRHTIFALRPPAIETEGFLPALKKFVKEFGMFTEIEVALNVQGDVNRLTSKAETALFRLTQEALNNVRKHARAKHVWVELRVEPSRTAYLEVRDDGMGFDATQAFQRARERGSVGLIQMRERVERAGGTFALETAPGKGTTIHVTLPLRER